MHFRGLKRLNFKKLLKTRGKLNQALMAIDEAGQLILKNKEEISKLFDREVNHKWFENQRSKIREHAQSLNNEIWPLLHNRLKRVYRGKFLNVKEYDELLDEMKTAINVIGKNIIDPKTDLQIVSLVQIIVKRLALRIIEEAKNTENKEICNQLLERLKISIEALSESAIVLKAINI